MGYSFGKAGLVSVQIPSRFGKGRTTTYLNFRELRRSCGGIIFPTPPEYHLIAGADHAKFSDMCSRNAAAGTLFAYRSTTGFDRGILHGDLDKSVTAFSLATWSCHGEFCKVCRPGFSLVIIETTTNLLSIVAVSLG